MLTIINKLQNHQITTSNIRIIKTSTSKSCWDFFFKSCVAIKEQELILAKSITLIPPVFHLEYRSKHLRYREWICIQAGHQIRHKE
jgi:hypothetical protein